MTSGTVAFAVGSRLTVGLHYASALALLLEARGNAEDTTAAAEIVVCTIAEPTQRVAIELDESEKLAVFEALSELAPQPLPGQLRALHAELAVDLDARE